MDIRVGPEAIHGLIEPRCGRGRVEADIACRDIYIVTGGVFQVHEALIGRIVAHQHGSERRDDASFSEFAYPVGYLLADSAATRSPCSSSVDTV